MLVVLVVVLVTLVIVPVVLVASSTSASSGSNASNSRSSYISTPPTTPTQGVGGRHYHCGGGGLIECGRMYVHLVYIYMHYLYKPHPRALEQLGRWYMMAYHGISMLLIQDQIVGPFWLWYL